MREYEEGRKKKLFPALLFCDDSQTAREVVSFIFEFV
jgi:hypothetical protein